MLDNPLSPRLDVWAAEAAALPHNVPSILSPAVKRISSFSDR